jgi:hypothetical protein
VNYSGDVNYSGEVEWTESDSKPYPVVVTKACVGDKIDGVQATGWTWALRRVKYRIAVRYFKPGASSYKVVFRTETEKEVVDGEFTDSIENGFTFEKPGTYAFIFWVFRPDGSVGSAHQRTIAVEEGEGCQAQTAAAGEAEEL